MLDKNFIKQILESVEFFIPIEDSHDTPFDVEILKNPTYSDIQDIGGRWHRGWITPDGDLYMGGDVLDDDGNEVPPRIVDDEVLTFVHEDLVERLSKEGIVGSGFNDNWWTGQGMKKIGIGIIQVEDTNQLKLAESYSEKIKEWYLLNFTTSNILNNFLKRNSDWELI